MTAPRAAATPDAVRLGIIGTGWIGLTRARPLSTMPGEPVGSVYAGPMEAETRHFIECVASGRRRARGPAGSAARR
jgi:predicted dehydrogenase